MKLRDKVPEWVGAPTNVLLDAIQNTMSDLIFQIADAYKLTLPMWRVLQEYGYDVGPDDGEVQLHCRLPSHGGVDNNKSARYFPSDRDTGGAWGGVHCWKCQKRKTAFWYVHAMEKGRSDATIRDVIEFIQQRFRVPFPRDVVLDFDPDEFYSLSGPGVVRDDLSARFAQARAVRENLKDADQGAYANALVAIYTARMSTPHGRPA